MRQKGGNAARGGLPWPRGTDLMPSGGCMLKRYINRVSSAPANLALSACRFLPTSGPSRNEVQTGAGGGIQVVDVNDGVARRLLETHSSRLLSDALSGTAGNSEAVGPGDVWVSSNRRA